MTRLFATLCALALLLAAPAEASYREAQARFARLPAATQTAVVMALIDSGDFDGLAPRFTPRLHGALRRFEARHGFAASGVIDPAQLRLLTDRAQRFSARLGLRSYSHPVTGAQLLVPRALFDAEQTSDGSLLFTRQDHAMSLAFISFPDSDRSYEQLWRKLSVSRGGRKVTYQRRFASRFVVTGLDQGSRFYIMMARTGHSTTGFTLSWEAGADETGRKLSVLLANVWLAQLP